MPPTPSQRGPSSYDNPSLSDQDVGFLYQIITRAERHPEVDRLPFRALFEAYDEVLKEHGVQADHGQVCLRFLFRMGSKEVHGNTLFEKFESLLAQLGITIELDDGDTKYDGYHTDNDASPAFNHAPKSSRTGHIETSAFSSGSQMRQGRCRRSSFNSMYDVGEDATQRSAAHRPSSRSSVSRLEVRKPEFLGFNSSSKRESTAKSPESPGRTQLLAQFLEAGRRLMNRMKSSEEMRKPGKPQLPNGYPLTSEVERIYADRKASPLSDERASSPDMVYEETSATEGKEIQQLDRRPTAPGMVYRPSLSDLLRDATTFDMYRQRVLHRRIITQWLKIAVQARQAHRNMELVAANRDRLTLLRQAFERLFALIQQKRQADRMERFFKHLEARAARARDLYLMTKAFTHWAEVTSEEVARTSAARRHILSVKYFNAWREITAVNELKTQRFALRRPFNQWQKRVQFIKAAEMSAISSYKKTLVQRVYWRWVQSHWDQQVPRWHAFRIVKRSFICWLRKFRTNNERNHDIESKDRRFLLASGLQAFSQKSKVIMSADRHAVSMRREMILRQTFRELRTQTHLAPIAFRVKMMVDMRVLRTAYMQWTQRAQILEAAKQLDQKRLKQNAWTFWNDLLRFRVLTSRIEERLKMETMYRWLLAERCRLMQRVRDKRISSEVFSSFVNNIRGTYSRLLYRVDLSMERTRKEMLQSKLDRWRTLLVLQRQRELIAFEFYAPLLQEESLVVWKDKYRQIRIMEEWAQRAEFYFLLMRYTKRWHTETLQSSKRRRQDAYAKVRRRVKISIATKCFDKWTLKTQAAIKMEQDALNFHRSKILAVSFDTLAQWHEIASKRGQDFQVADDYHARKLAYNKLTRLAEALVENHNRTEQANQVRRKHILSQSAAQLRKLSLRVFQIKSSDETAQSMRERNLRKHSRIFLRHWAENIRERRETRALLGPSTTQTPARNLTYDGRLDGAPSFDPWYQVETPFKLSELMNTSEAPRSTSLETPSEAISPYGRAARAKPFTQPSTTPATPLYTPFAGRLLRAQASTPRITSIRRERSERPGSIGASVRFVDEIPESPSDGRKSANKRI